MKLKHLLLNLSAGLSLLACNEANARPTERPSENAVLVIHGG